MIRHLNTGAASDTGQDQQRFPSGRCNSTVHRAGLDTSQPTADAEYDERIDTPVCAELDDAAVNEAAAFAAHETNVGDPAIAAATGGRLLLVANPARTRTVRTAQRSRVVGQNSTATMQGLEAAHYTWSRFGLLPMSCRSATLSPAQSPGAPAMVPAASR